MGDTAHGAPLTGSAAHWLGGSLARRLTGYAARRHLAWGYNGLMPSYRLSPHTELRLVSGDITRLRVDAIVNAANERMLGGGGVDGAIHAAAGPELLDACRRVPEVRPNVRCPTGEARITPGFRLPARHVIHTVGPVYADDTTSAPLLASAYASSLALANEHELRSIAFPAISCGVYGYPWEQAARVSLDALASALRDAPDVEQVRVVLFSDALLRTFEDALERLRSRPPPAESREGARPPRRGGYPPAP